MTAAVVVPFPLPAGPSSLRRIGLSRLDLVGLVNYSARMLRFGEVRRGRGETAIGCESLPDVGPSHRDLYQRAVAGAGVELDVVLVVRATEAAVEVDVIDFDDVRWP